MSYEYYIYAYLDPTEEGNFEYSDSIKFNNLPFYIGKGKNKRMFKHLKNSSNTRMNERLIKIREKGKEPIIIKIIEDITEDRAFDLEKIYIKSIGRIVTNTGPLLNLTKGGNGFKGCNSYRGGFNKKHSEETKKRLSEINKGKSFIEKVGENKAKLWIENIKKGNIGKKRQTPESIIRIKNLWLGKKIPEEIRNKMSEGRKGISPYNKGKIIYRYSKDNEFLDSCFLFEIPEKFKVPCSNIIKCCKNERKSAGGYIWKYKKE